MHTGNKKVYWGWNTMAITWAAAQSWDIPANLVSFHKEENTPSQRRKHPFMFMKGCLRFPLKSNI